MAESAMSDRCRAPRIPTQWHCAPAILDKLTYTAARTPSNAVSYDW